MKFRTVLDRPRDVDIYGLPENVEVESVRFVIDWEVQIETREWGIKDFSPVITNIAGEYELETWSGNGNIVSAETVNFDFEPYRENCKFAAELTGFRQLSISSIVIDLGDESLEVS